MHVSVKAEEMKREAGRVAVTTDMSNEHFARVDDETGCNGPPIGSGVRF